MARNRFVMMRDLSWITILDTDEVPAAKYCLVPLSYGSDADEANARAHEVCRLLNQEDEIRRSVDSRGESS